METFKRLIIFLLLAVGVFATVEFINYKVESATNWGVNPTVLSSKDTTLKQTASVKASSSQARPKIKTTGLSG